MRYCDKLSTFYLLNPRILFYRSHIGATFKWQKYTKKHPYLHPYNILIYNILSLYFSGFYVLLKSQFCPPRISFTNILQHFLVLDLIWLPIQSVRRYLSMSKLGVLHKKWSAFQYSKQIYRSLRCSFNYQLSQIYSAISLCITRDSWGFCCFVVYIVVAF